MIGKYINKLNNYRMKKEWRKRNKHNFTSISRANSLNYVEVGKYTYGMLNVHVSNGYQKLRIGSFCSIASNVYFLLSAEHNLSTISTYPFRSQLLNSVHMEGMSKGDIIVDDDVWIGYGAIILSGIRIGQGAVVAAGTVVTKDIPPYAIVGGNPAKIIKYRFERKVIDQLVKIDFSSLSKEFIESNITQLYDNVNDDLVKIMPKR